MKSLPVLITFIILLVPAGLLSQQNDVGNWLMYFGANRVSDQFSIHTEVQYRNHTLAPVNTEQLLLRAGINYHFSDQAFASAGYAYIGSHVYDSDQSHPESEEHRVWQQLIINNYLARVKFEHRYRLEQRWTSTAYANRFRYRLMLFVPLNKPKIEKGTVFLGLYDEIFINGKANYFDRNRLYGAVGYQFNKAIGLQLGFLNQRVNAAGKYYLQASITVNPDLRAKK